MTLEAMPTGAGDSSVHLRALNDVVLHKGGFARVLRLRVLVNRRRNRNALRRGRDRDFDADRIDSVSRFPRSGPIVAPTVESLLITPVSPHTPAVRPILLPPDAVITVQPEDAPQRGFGCDGRRAGWHELGNRAGADDQADRRIG